MHAWTATVAVFAQSDLSKDQTGLLIFIGLGVAVVIAVILVGVVLTSLRRRRLLRIADEVTCRACGSDNVDVDENCANCGFSPRLEGVSSLAVPLARLQKLRYARDQFAHAARAMARSRNLAVADLANMGGGEASQDAMVDGQNALMHGWDLLQEITRENPDLLQIDIAELRMGEGIADILNAFAAQSSVNSIKKLQARVEVVLAEETERFREHVRSVA